MNTLMMVKRPKNAKGFTLIELMIAIAIVGVLAAIAVPAFSNYLARARISEAINYAQGCKVGFIEYYSTNGTLPANNAQANCPTISTSNVQGVTVNARGIIVQLSTGTTIPTAARGQFIYVQPLNNAATPALAVNGDTIVSWACSIGQSGTTATAASAAALDLVPAICRNAPR